MDPCNAHYRSQSPQVIPDLMCCTLPFFGANNMQAWSLQRYSAGVFIEDRRAFLGPRMYVRRDLGATRRV